MANTTTDQPFRLSTGGVFHRLVQRLLLIDGNELHPWRRIVFLTGITWLPLMILCSIDGTLFGTGVDIPFLHDPEPHIRYLLALPLLVIASVFIDSYMKVIVQHFSISGLVPADKQPLYDKALKEFGDQRDAAWVDIILLC